MNKQTRLTSELKVYVWWPLLLSIFLAVMTVCVFVVDKQSGVLVSCFVFVYTIAAILMYFTKRHKINVDLLKFACQHGQVQKSMLKELKVAYAMIDREGKILWKNDEFCELVNSDSKNNVEISKFFPEITQEALPKDPEDAEDNIMDISYGDKFFNVVIRRTYIPMFENEDEISEEQSLWDSGNVFYTVYFYDRTDIVNVIKENHDTKLVIGLLYIDNYNDAIESIDESKRPLVVTLVERKITKYMGHFDALMTKLEKDRFIFVMRQENLDALKANKFAIIDEIRNSTKDAKNETRGNEVTISIGISEFTGSTMATFTAAKEAMELTIGRGGNSVTIKDKDGKVDYAGGKNVNIEKSDEKVKARTRADNIKDFISKYNTVFVMGHRNCDSDSFGSALGMCRYAKEFGKTAYLVIENDLRGSVLPMVERISNNKVDFGELIIKPEEALSLIGDASMLFVVDTAVEGMVASPEVLKSFSKEDIIVIDHHRQGTESIAAEKLYIEPNASSASELVIELIQLTFPNLRVMPAEAEAFYAGIYIDTNNFTLKTGARTFEAAAYLRKCGADIQKIRKMFRIDQSDYVRKSKAINATEIFKAKYAITYCANSEDGGSDELAAQVANELLNISKISGSFVVTEKGDKFKVSARSIDELNVEIIMKELGGGGHGDAAAAVFEAQNVEEAIRLVKNSILKLTEEGKI